MAQILIRPMEDRDKATVSRMMHDLWRIHAAKSRYVSKRYLDNVNARKEMRKRNQIFIVAEADGKVVGYAHLSVSKFSNFFTFKKIIYLDEIYVSKRYRGIGVGKALLKETKRIAWKKDLHIMTTIWPFSTSMKRLFSEAQYVREAHLLLREFK
ncbi:MAG: GNAT family N-acetyltransferase [Candidatus Micrarchaeota archaeon]|nr:GNAT family N-acetyltransferase [Candidatus Micrarchaeota archaeon]